MFKVLSTAILFIFVAMLSIFTTIILLGSLQGFIIGSIFLFKSRKLESAKWLGWLLLLMGLTSVHLLVMHSPVLNSHFALRIIRDFIPLTIVMPLGPLIYFYTKSSLGPSETVTASEKKLLWLVLLDFGQTVIAILFFALAFARLIVPNPTPWGYVIDTYNMCLDLPRWISVTFFLYSSYKILVRHRNATLSPERKKRLLLFVKVFAVFQLIWLLQLVPYLANGMQLKILGVADWYTVYVPMSILIYWLGIEGLITITRTALSDKKSGGVTIATIPTETIASVQERLQIAMERDRLFLDPELDLAGFVKKINVPSRTVSAVLNQSLNKSFNDFVNEFRVEELKKRMVQEQYRQLTIASIARDCGFKSQSTFQRVFKNMTGMTPSQYLKKTESSTGEVG